MRMKLTMLALIAMLAGGSAQAIDAQAGEARCQQLMAYYDRYVFWPDDSTPIGYMQREMGEQECKAGRYESGIAELVMALRLIGFPPPPG